MKKLHITEDMIYIVLVAEVFCFITVIYPKKLMCVMC